MKTMRCCLFLLAVLVAPFQAQTTPARFTIEQVLSPPFPLNLVAARSAERIAWIENERGMRNVYTASAPDFSPVRLTAVTEDDGVDMRPMQISDDGSVVTYIRGHAPGVGGAGRMPEWLASPLSEPDGGKNEIWAVTTDGKTKPWRVVAARTMELAPDGRSVLYVKDGQIHLAKVDPGLASSQDDAPPLMRVFGVNGSDQAYQAANRPVWSPDGRKVAFVSMRRDHSFVTVYDLASRKISYMAPSVDFDSAPVWSPDGARIAFIRKPGLAFGQQTEPTPMVVRGKVPVGFTSATLRGGYTTAIMVADVATGDADEIWHNAPGDTIFAEVARIYWAGNHIVFDAEPDNWRHFYSIAVSSPGMPVLLTPGEGEVEHVSFTNDGRWLYYAGNIGDLDRRALWRVPVAGGKAEKLTNAPGLDTFPAPLASGERIAVLHATQKTWQSVAIVPATGGIPKVLKAPPAGFPTELHVEPQAVTLTAADGLTSYAQVFLPPDLKAGDKRPAVLFIHGGSRQQTLLGYHYKQPDGFYGFTYAMCQYFANKGYIAMSVNYRSGIGYGREFRLARNYGAAGNSEYRDVLAAGLYLKARPDVDATRIGVWGLSYGGILTSQALARNSDVFAAGADIGGVHLRGAVIDPEEVSYYSSSSSAIETWKSPVILFAGDDDRNVDFSQTVGLVQLLRAHKVPYELTVFPNDTHYFLVYGRWMQTFKAIDDFFDRVLIRKEPVRTSHTTALTR